MLNRQRTGSFIDNIDKGGELSSFEAEKMLKIVRHMALRRTQLNPNRLGSLWVSQKVPVMKFYKKKFEDVCSGSYWKLFGWPKSMARRG